LGRLCKSWHHYGFASASCLEIGCGAGRLTKQIANVFQRVIAVDVSEDMLAFAKQRVPEPNVEFLLGNGINLPAESDSVTAVFSAHVVQHLDSTEVGVALFREIYRVLKTSGSFMVHLPLYHFPDKHRVFRTLWRVREHVSSLRAEMSRLRKRKVMRYTQYPMHTVHSSLLEIGFDRIEFRSFPVRSVPGFASFHSFVFATK
jgi:ubiquinone/menaquinone biosynthesis C-methylase UbiE